MHHPPSFDLLHAQSCNSRGGAYSLTNVQTCTQHFVVSGFVTLNGNVAKYLDGNTLCEGHPLAYLLTFSCYGTHLHGHAGGSIDRSHNVFGTPFIPASKRREQANRCYLSQRPFNLDTLGRKLVLDSIRQVSCDKGWDLIAAHVRSGHVHSIVGADCTPERILRAFKYRASRHLAQNAYTVSGRKVWTRGGSNRYLWTPKQVAAAVHYVVLCQGESMEIYEKRGWQFQFS
jgi:REP element-mobilizing transposase RayT